MDTIMPRVRRAIYGTAEIPLTRGELTLYTDLVWAVETSPRELEEALFQAAMRSPRRDYWRMAAAIHIYLAFSLLTNLFLDGASAVPEFFTDSPPLSFLHQNSASKSKICPRRTT